MLERDIYDLVDKALFKGKVIIITGARQTGKTTFLKQLASGKNAEDILFLNCDEPDIRSQLENVTSARLRVLIGSHKFVLIDEAQRVENIGLTLKLIIDNIGGVQIIATGSSAFDLRNKLNEPLTGRKFEFHLYPFSTGELIKQSSVTEERRLLEQRLIYGMYPDIVNNPSDAPVILRELSNSYLFKDVFSYRDIYVILMDLQDCLLHLLYSWEVKYRTMSWEGRWGLIRRLLKGTLSCLKRCL